MRYHGGDVDGRDDMEQWGWRGARYSSDKADMSASKRSR